MKKPGHCKRCDDFVLEMDHEWWPVCAVCSEQIRVASQAHAQEPRRRGFWSKLWHEGPLSFFGYTTHVGG